MTGKANCLAGVDLPDLGEDKLLFSFLFWQNKLCLGML